jgi:hypothetical protein
MEIMAAKVLSKWEKVINLIEKLEGKNERRSKKS